MLGELDLRADVSFDELVRQASVIDPSIERDVRLDLRILRARTLEPGYGVKQAAWTASLKAVWL